MKLLTAIKNRIAAIISWFLNKSLIVKIIILAVIILLGWFTLPRFLGSKQQQVQYETAQAAKGTLVTSVTGSGNISTGNSVGITTQATGVITTVYVKIGDSVTKGEKLADITLDQSSQQRQQSAWATYLSAQNNLNTQQAKMNSLQSALFKANQAFVNDKGIQNPTDADKVDPKYIEENADWLQSEADYKNQAGVISQAQTALSNQWLAYQQASPTIVAPADGTITNLTINAGFPITSSTNSSGANTSASTQSVGIISIQGGQIEAIVNISEIDVTKVKPAEKATMTLDAFPNKTFTGHVASINTSGSVSSNVTSYPTTIVFDVTDPSIYSNMAVDAKIITDVKDNVLLVPSTAIQSQNGSTTVRVLKNGQPQSVDVTVGESSDTQTEVTSGLSDGDTVITGTTTPITGTGATSSPFSGSGFGIFRAGGGGGFGGGAGGGRGGGGTGGGGGRTTGGTTGR